MRRACLYSILISSLASCRDDSGSSPDAPPIEAGPLAGLPSAPGPTVAEIEALGDDQWLSLGAPQADPAWGPARGRSWGGRALIPAPDLRGAFFTGEGVHAFVKPDGHIMDDVFFYDLNAHRWIAVYPGTDTTTFTQRVQEGELLIDDDGQLVDRSAQPLPVHILIHAWDFLSYDPIARRFALHAGDALGRYYLGGEAEVDEGLTMLEAQRATKTIPPMSPWFYDVAAGRFARTAIAAAAPDVGSYAFFQYVGSRRQYFLGGSAGAAFFDPAAGSWTLASDTGPRPPGYDHGGCYDELRDRIYMGSGDADPTGALYIYDLALDTWTKPTANGTPPQSFRTNEASTFYDSANDVVTVFQYGVGRIFTWVPSTDTWSDRPLPDEVLDSVGYPSFNAFYDAELNAYFVYAATDSADNGVMWAYRYRNP